MGSFRARRTLTGLAVVTALAGGGCSSGDDKTEAGGAVPASATPSSGPAPAPTEATKAKPSPSLKPKPTTGKPQPNVTWTPSGKPAKPKPVPAPTTVKAGQVQQNVKELSYCSPLGATGYTKTRKKMTCTIIQGDERTTWRAA